MPWRRASFVAATFAILFACSTKSGVVENAAPPTSQPRDASSSEDAASSEGDGDGGRPPAVDGPKSVYHFVGRFDTRAAEGPRFGWPGTSIRTRFSGTGVKVTLRSIPRDTETDQLDVSIDGAAPTVLKTNPDSNTYTVASGLADGEHDLVLTKRTESAVGTLQLLAIESTEGRPLIPTALAPTHLIEFVGDSITCGYGVLGTSPCKGTANTQSELSAYGGVTASLLGTDHATICASGIGIYRSNQNSTDDQMPTRYLLTLPDDPTSTWNFAYTPDVVVVNLGTNDFEQGNPGTPYRDAMTSFATFLRSKYPNAQIVLSVSTMVSGTARTSMSTALTQVVSTRTSAGDTKISFFAFDEELAADGLGCDLHPSATTQKKSAAKLAAYLHTLMGW